MDRTEHIRRIYAIILGVFTVAVGIAIICVAADIYYSNGEYTRELAGDRLLKLAIPCVFLIAAIIAGAVFPLVLPKVKPRAEDAVAKLVERIPTGGDGEAYATALAEYDKTKKLRLVVWLVALGISLAAAIVVLWYLIDTSHFSSDFTADIFRLVRVVMPVTAAGFASLVFAAVYNGFAAKKQLAALKALIKSGNGEKRGNTDPAFIAAAKRIVNSTAMLWAVRGVLLVIAVTFIIVGVLNKGADDVLTKAIKICTECIGLG